MLHGPDPEESVWGAVDLREHPQEGGGGSEPRGGLSDPQSSPAYQPQTLLQSTLGDLNSPFIYKAQLIPVADPVQAPALLLMLLPCIELAIIAHQPLVQAPQHGRVCCCTPARGRGAILNLSTLLEGGARMCKYKLFICLVMHPG